MLAVVHSLLMVAGRVLTVGGLAVPHAGNLHITVFVFSLGLDSPENVLLVCCLEGIILAASLSGTMWGSNLSVSTAYLQMLT